MAGILQTFVGGLVPGLTSGVSTALPYLNQLAHQGTVLSDVTAEARLLHGLASPAAKLSANEIIRQLRGAGFKVNRQKALRAIKAVRSSIDLADNLNAAGRTFRPRQAQIPLSPHRQSHKYYIKATVSVYNTELDELQLKHITLRSSKILSAGEIQDAIANLYATAEQYSGLVYEEHLVTAYTIRNPSLQ